MQDLYHQQYGLGEVGSPELRVRGSDKSGTRM